MNVTTSVDLSDRAASLSYIWEILNGTHICTTEGYLDLHADMKRMWHRKLMRPRWSLIRRATCEVQVRARQLIRSNILEFDWAVNSSVLQVVCPGTVTAHKEVASLRSQ